MHHTWNALIINKEAGLVRMFQTSEYLPTYMLSAQSTLKYTISQGLLDISDIDVSHLRDKLNDVCVKSKKILKNSSSEHLWYSDEELNNVSELVQLMPTVEWHVFVSSSSKPERWRYSVESAAFLSGLNPVANYLPFTDGYTPPNDIQFGKLLERITETRRRLSILKILNEQLSKERISLFWELYIKDRFHSVLLTEEQHKLFTSIFRDEIPEIS